MNTSPTNWGGIKAKLEKTEIFDTVTYGALSFERAL
jgi:hypothetical protein